MKMRLLSFVACVLVVSNAHGSVSVSVSRWSTVNKAGGWGGFGSTSSVEAGRFDPHHARAHIQAANQAPASGDTHQWSYDPYDLDIGPSKWPTMPGFATCAGTSQSPVPLPSFAYAQPDATLKKLDPSYRSAHPYNLTLSNTGHALQVDMPSTGASLLRGGALGENPYEVVQLHMHARSEHSVAGAHYPLEIHIVHRDTVQDSMDQYAVLGIMVQESADGTHNTALQPITDLIADFGTAFNHFGISVNIAQRFDLYNLLPKNLDYYHYSGSLTTPPCSQQVLWHVLNTPISASRDQILALTAPFGTVGNSRPTQPLNGRKVTSFKSGLATGRYVRIQAQTGSTTALNIAEVQVFDMYDVNIALNKPVSMSSTYSNFVSGNLVDGSTSTFAHTNNEKGAFMSIDLGASTQISKITVLNRVDSCCTGRLVGSVVQVQPATQTGPYWTSNPLTAALEQHFSGEVGP